MLRMFNSISRLFFLNVMFNTSTISGLLIAVSLTLESTWSRLIYLIYPMGLLLAASLVCSFGQFLEDSVSIFVLFCVSEYRLNRSSPRKWEWRSTVVIG